MKKSYLLLLTLILMVVLAACGTNERQKKTTDKDEFKVGEAMQEDKQHIWYVSRDDTTSELDKDSDVSKVIVTKNGKMRVYVHEAIPPEPLGYLVKKSDKQTIKDLEKEDKRNFESSKDYYIDMTNKEIKEAKRYIKEGKEEYRPSNYKLGYAMIEEERNGVSPQDSIKKLEDYKSKVEKTTYKKPQARDVDLRFHQNREIISTDRQYGFPKPLVNAEYIDDEDSIAEFNNTVQPTSINGHNVGGLSNADGNETEDNNNQSPYLITKLDKDIKKVKLDETDDPSMKSDKK
ncbi:hypothetical protein [Staphylococcus haemolyticus]|uniref:hypothetical protein n=1 Tax=Staphylococcus haemolyticus TaxID=1283 RepID=UPI00265B9DAC|nr:hypothetical protein [Staphylococcus haemolyticus]MDO0971680.1 hypothetical protein [Staphylococcus haemolyticus]